MTEPDDAPADGRRDATAPDADLPIEADEADALEQSLPVPDHGEDDYR